MQIATVFLVVLSGIAAFIFAFFQYCYNTKRSGYLPVILCICRSIAVFCGLLLLINPKFVKNDYYIEKSNLIFLVDNSSSMASSTDPGQVDAILDKIIQDRSLQQKVAMHRYSFGADLAASDSLSFGEKATNIAKALTSVKEIHNDAATKVVLLTDGNQTLGVDYEYFTFDKKFSVLPVIFGDTTTYQDLAVTEVNLNKYSFLKNKFPVEATVVHRGATPIATKVKILMDGRIVHQENVQFNVNETSKTITTFLNASTVGIKSLVVQVDSITNERNRNNNRKETAIEVIDEKTEVAIVTAVNHPDIGALKKAVEANEQRVVRIIDPTSANEEQLNEVDVFILYQPNVAFTKIHGFVTNANAPTFTIVGLQTDIKYVNKQQQTYAISDGYPEQEVFGINKNSLRAFDISDFSVEGYPPLSSNAGPISITGTHDVLFHMGIKGTEMPSPLMWLFANNGKKEVVLVGENIWKWRMQSYRNEQTFLNFDTLIGKLMRYLADGGQKSRIELNYSTVYEGAVNAKIQAAYFDETFVFQPNSNLLLKVKGIDNNFSRQTPMLLRGNYFQTDLSDLPAGKFFFTVTETGTNRVKSGTFKILDFDAEQQFLSSNHKKLGRLAKKAGENTYYPDNLEALLQHLINADELVPLQKSRQNVVSLIDFRLLLAIMAAAFAMEWLLRKYNGML
ncbi:MAG: VWA domain-containing protein [Bacteroidota bacterium]